MERKPVISALDLSKRFGELRAGARVSFTVGEGELFGLLGPNGAGKTTTISMLCGLLKPDEGTVQIGDFNLWTTPRRAKRLLGLVPQDLALYEEFSARDNLMFWGGLYGLNHAELKRHSAELLERVGLGESGRAPV